ncbi:MAG: MBL fold metallo-hydrolase [Clostridia bacterium]|nr:MBL fold metallo-hydrolase [Clostridia bacterium]
MLKLYSIISGSSGNCSLLTDGKTNILIDCGTSGKRATEALESLAVPANRINAILVSHEHIDHTKGVGILSRRFNIPVYATSGTHYKSDFGKLDDLLIHEISPDVTYDIAGIGVTPFSIPHDASEPCGFIATDGHKKFATATDIGIMTDAIISRLGGCDSILLESNHDIEMLRFGEYPYALKQRILSDIGHLSNKAAARAAFELVKRGTKHLMLGHLSDKNNLPDIAQMETYNFLTDNGINVGVDVTLQVAERYKITPFISGE